MTGVKFTEKFYRHKNGSHRYQDWEKCLIDAGGHWVTKDKTEKVPFVYRPNKKYGRAYGLDLSQEEDGLCAKLWGCRKSYSPDEVTGMIDKIIPWVVSMASEGYLEYNGEVYE